MSTSAEIAARVAALDTSLLSAIPSETTDHDRSSLLALHAAVAERGDYVYLEIGSHLGGSMQAHIADPRCTAIISIDTRPASQPDDRGEVYHYEDNSTARMLDLLATVPGADLSKLSTFELGTDELDITALPAPPVLCLIDGEHTYGAASRDAAWCLAAAVRPAVIAFHDSNVVQGAIDEFVRGLGDTPHAPFQLRDSVGVVQVGATDLPDHPAIARTRAS